MVSSDSSGSDGEETQPIEGEYEAPGFDGPCPRTRPDGGPTCEHRAGRHDERGICRDCVRGAAAFRLCARPRAQPF